MGQIGNTILYPFDVSVSLLDYLIGTDFTDNKKVKSYQLKRLVEILNIVNGGSAVAYHFSDGSNVDLTVLEPGYFFSETNAITPATLTKLHFNKLTIENKDISVFFDKMIASGLFKFKLSNLSDPNNFIYLSPSNTVLSTEYLSFNVATFNNLYSGNLINNADYVLSFDLASNLTPVTDPLKLDKSTYMGNAQDLDNRISELEAETPVDYAKVVYVNAASPNLATIFDVNHPPVANDNSLKQDTSNLYIGSDTAPWIWNTIVSGYVSKLVPLTSNFFLKGTTTDAGNNKNASIHRNGAISAANLSGTNTGDQDLSGKVDKVTGKSLILDTEITRLAGVSNVDVSGKENTSNKQNSLATDGTGGKYPTVDAVKAGLVLKQNSLVLDESLVFYDVGGVQTLGSNVSNITSSFIWLTGNSTTFTLPFTPTNLSGIFINGLKLYNSSQFTMTLPNQITILQTLSNGDVVDFNYEHYNN